MPRPVKVQMGLRVQYADENLGRSQQQSKSSPHQLGARHADDALPQRVQHRRVVRRLVDEVQQLIHEPRALLPRVQPRVRLRGVRVRVRLRLTSGIGLDQYSHPALGTTCAASCSAAGSRLCIHSSREACSSDSVCAARMYWVHNCLAGNSVLCSTSGTRLHERPQRQPPQPVSPRLVGGHRGGCCRLALGLAPAGRHCRSRYGQRHAPPRGVMVTRPSAVKLVTSRSRAKCLARLQLPMDDVLMTASTVCDKWWTLTPRFWAGETRRRWKAPRPGSASRPRECRAYSLSSLARRYGSMTCSGAIDSHMRTYTTWTHNKQQLWMNVRSEASLPRRLAHGSKSCAATGLVDHRQPRISAAPRHRRCASPHQQQQREAHLRPAERLPRGCGGVLVGDRHPPETVQGLREGRAACGSVRAQLDSACREREVGKPMCQAQRRILLVLPTLACPFLLESR